MEFLHNKIERHSRHLYDIYKLLPQFKQLSKYLRMEWAKNDE